MLHCPKLPLEAARGQLKFIETEVEVKGCVLVVPGSWRREWA